MKNKKKMSVVGVIILLLIGAAASRMEPGDVPLPEKSAEAAVQNVDGMLYVHYIDVGQGDSIFIELPNDETMLIDAGENDQGEAVCSYIEAQGEDTVDYLVGTHPHSDHIGGLDTVIERFDIGTLFLPDKSHTTKTFADVVNAAKDKQVATVQAKAGVTILQANGLTLEFLSPASAAYEELNDYSAVVSLIYGETSFLFTGDAEYTVEKELESVVSHYDVLKVGHHGSNTSSTANFLEKVRPACAVISCGADNSYGHPTPQVLNRLERFGCTIYRTDQNGSVVAASDGTRITFETER